MKKEQTGFSRYMALTFTIGFGFLTMGLMDPLYDTYLPLFLRQFIASNGAVGVVMSLDNLLQLFLIPVVAVWSDKTRTRIGRRMPFIIIMLPLAAVFFALIPFLVVKSLATMIAIIFFFNIFKTAVRGPIVTLMPDTVPAEYRSEANGVINTMGGLGLIVSTLLLARLTLVPLGKWRYPGVVPFGIAAIFVIIATIVMFLFVRENPSPGDEVRERRGPISAVIRIFTGEAKNSVGRILIAIFFWFLAYEGIKPFLGLYLVEYVGVGQKNAALAQGIAGISGVLLAMPSGYIAHKIGRRRFIRICLAALTLVLAAIPTAAYAGAGLLPDTRLFVFLGLMFIYGIFWIGIVVNSFPMLWQISTRYNVGIFTGLYYTFSQTAAIAAPPLAGLVIDFGGYPGLFIFGAVSMLIACIVMSGVKAGEADAAPQP